MALWKPIAEQLADMDARREARTTRLDKIEESTTSEGIKALLAINGGGAVAMLGFMQALLQKNTSPGAIQTSTVFADFKYFGANALLFFCIGIATAALIPCAKLVQIALERRSFDYAIWAARLISLFWVISVLAFLVGAGVAGIGIDRALN